MGVLRFLLALAVVIAHSNSLFGLNFVGGVIAVESFFIVSGFYMAFIWHEKYSLLSNSYSKFIINRLLRIYPLYWVVLAITLIFLVSTSILKRAPFWTFYYYANCHHPVVFCLILLSNILIVGLDIIMFLGFDSAGGIIVNKPHSMNVQFRFFNFIPPAWTLSIEILFYFLAPFILKRGKFTVIFIFLASLTIKIALNYYHYDYDFFEYGFFPSELMFFCSGIISYYIYRKIINELWAPKYGVILQFILSFMILFFQHLPFNTTVNKYLLYSIIVCSIPFIFMYSKNFKWDRWLGELSYPLYIIHWLVVFLMKGVFVKYHYPDSYLGLSCIIISILMAITITKYIVSPIEEIRAKRVQNG